MLRENFQTPDFSNKNTPMNQDLQRQSEGLPELENHMIELGT